ncbi:hypothetical protein T5B8_11516 [Salinisphaera sp. T5B8]
MANIGQPDRPLFAILANHGPQPAYRCQALKKHLAHNRLAREPPYWRWHGRCIDPKATYDNTKEIAMKQWTTPKAHDLRLGFEITMYVNNR